MANGKPTDNNNAERSDGERAAAVAKFRSFYNTSNQSYTAEVNQPGREAYIFRPYVSTQVNIEDAEHPAIQALVKKGVLK